MNIRANPTDATAPTTSPSTWKRNCSARGVPSRQPVERSCCMSAETLQATSSTPPAIMPTPGSLSPSAAISTMAVTNAAEIGVESLMPSEMPLTNANTNNVGLDLGTASFSGGSDSLACVAYAHIGSAMYQVSSAFDVVVTKANTSSPNFRMSAQISTPPPFNVTWLINNVPLTNTGFSTLDTADNYGQAITKTLQVQVKNPVPAQILQETITFLATAN